MIKMLKGYHSDNEYGSSIVEDRILMSETKVKM